MLVDDDILPSRNFDELAYFRTPVAATFGPGHELIFGNLLVEKSSLGLLWFSHMRALFLEVAYRTCHAGFAPSKAMMWGAIAEVITDERITSILLK